ncbi:hypothetical protein WMY93_034070, partial [Mugilogobius chulae]
SWDLTPRAVRRPNLYEGSRHSASVKGTRRTTPEALVRRKFVDTSVTPERQFMVGHHFSAEHARVSERLMLVGRESYPPLQYIP